MDNVLSKITNVVTRVARDDNGNYKLLNGDVTPFYDPGNAAAYERTAFSSFKTYTLTGIDGVYNTDGSARHMSIGQMAMAICLKRAAELEQDIIKVMETMSENTAQINALTLILEKIAEKNDGINTIGDQFSEIGFTDEDMAKFNSYGKAGWQNNFSNRVLSDYYDYWLNDFGFSVNTSADKTPEKATEIQTAIETKLDSLNTISQEKLIELQSLTTKRDQSYDLIATMLKSLNSTMMGIANNV